MTSISVQDVIADLAGLDENTSTGQYGYYLEDDGTLVVEVWNDSYHGTKAEYKVKIELELLHDYG